MPVWPEQVVVVPEPPAAQAGVCSGMFKIAVATVLFGAAHSLLAGTGAKSLAVSYWGERLANGLYRPAYLLVTIVLVGLLVWCAWRQPGRELYHVRGVVWWLLRAGQMAAVGVLGWAVYHVGLDFMTGWDSLTAWWTGAAEVPRMPDGQGPAPAGGIMRATGPFAYTRHPLNWVIVPLFWLNPRMTTRLLAFNLVTAVYVVVGSIHDEAHLLDAYEAAYRWYLERVPFFLG